MHHTIRTAGILFLSGIGLTAAFGQSTVTLPAWNPAKAAAYLDKRATWWIGWPTSARDQGTFCVSCHTATPLSLGRASLRGALDEAGVSPNEQKVLDSVAKRVRMWHDVEPFYSDQAARVTQILRIARYGIDSKFADSRFARCANGPSQQRFSAGVQQHVGASDQGPGYEWGLGMAPIS